MNDLDRARIEELGKEIVHSAVQVHRALGPGLLESVYQTCLGYELEQSGLVVESEVKIPLRYKELSIDAGYRVDMLVERAIVIENKAVERLQRVHTAQILTYLELSGCRLGFLLNWHVPRMKHGIRRFVMRL